MKELVVRLTQLLFVVLAQLLHQQYELLLQKFLNLTPLKLLVRVVKGKNYSNIDENMLINEFRKRVGKDTELRIEYVDELAPSNSGKLRFVVSDIKEGKLYQHQEA
jgi:hypothetical protein